MPVVPITAGSFGSDPDALKASETNLLMALAEMHKQGRVATPKADKAKPFKGPKQAKISGPL